MKKKEGVFLAENQLLDYIEDQMEGFDEVAEEKINTTGKVLYDLCKAFSKINSNKCSKVW